MRIPFLLLLAVALLVIAVVGSYRRDPTPVGWRYRLSRFVPVPFTSSYYSHHVVGEGPFPETIATPKRTRWVQWRDQIFLERTQTIDALPA